MSEQAANGTGADESRTRVDVRAIRRSQIIRAVRELIARDGLDAVTIANIADQANMSRGVVTYHFANRDAILRAVLETSMVDADRTATPLPTEELTPDELPSMVLRVAGLMEGGSDWWPIVFAYLAEAHVNEEYQTILARADQRYRHILEKSVGSQGGATILLALVKGLAMQQYVDPDLRLEDVRQEIAKFVAVLIGNANKE